jgi:hypothetical protein
MAPRIRSYREFWPHYLAHHRSRMARKLSFAGTTGLMLSLAGSFALNPLSFPAALAGSGLILWHGARAEPKGPPLRHTAAVLAPLTAASPVVFPLGLAFACGCSWTGQAVFARRLPTALRYPIWSTVSDLRLYGHMLRGRLWDGDPLEELGLAGRAPGAAPERGATRP